MRIASHRIMKENWARQLQACMMALVSFDDYPTDVDGSTLQLVIKL